ncbi:MAG: hypothetical protein JW973_17255 [Bacteroidales bacterium]|nr:hypothetical protein [Bacteroidales bacterium]
MLHHKTVYQNEADSFDLFATAVYKYFEVQYPKFYKMDKLSKLGFLSAELLLRDKEISQKYAGHEVGIILMNAASSLDTDRHYQDTITDRANYFPSPAVFVYTLPNIVIGEISIRHKLFGEGAFFIQEEFDPTFMVTYIKHLFDTGVIQCCLAGWVEVEGDNYESAVYFVEKTDIPNDGIANFEPATIKEIFAKEK